MSQIEIASSIVAAAADQKVAAEAGLLASAASIDESYLRKKFKKRERSPSGSVMLNESPPSQPSSSSVFSTSSSSGGGVAASQSSSATAAQTTGAAPGQPTPASLTPSNQQQQQKKEKQRPETWNKNEQQIFFNALRQNGKNFESITQYFNARQKRYKIDDGATVQRSKEQIRHFYYRTWHKIIKYISLPTTTLKENENQSSSLRDIQVNCLIAFNALMNKLHRWNKKAAIKLVELVNHGWTTVREKGKITRLRMPICKVSSKSIAVDSESGNQLPTTIQVQLEPRNEAAYCRVHKLAQNPFLSIEIQTLQSVKYLIEFLENKWKNRRNQYIDKFQINDDQAGKGLAKSAGIADSDTETPSEKNGVGSAAVASNGTAVAGKRTLPNEAGAVDSFSERLVLFPSESHQISNLDLYEASSAYSVYDETSESDIVASAANCALASALATPSAPTNEGPSSAINDLIDLRIKLKSPLRPEEQQDAVGIAQPGGARSTAASKHQDAAASVDEEMLDESAAAVANLASTPTRPQKRPAGESQQAPPSKNARSCFQLTCEQLRAGLTTSNASLVSLGGAANGGRESKELTFIQLYLALNKPKVISLKYDWASTLGGSSSGFNSLTSVQNQQQRFYIDTLANVASSYLIELQRPKSGSLQSQAEAPAVAVQTQPTPQPNKAASNGTPPPPPSLASLSSMNKSTSPTKLPIPTFTSTSMPSSVAIVQPSLGTTTVVPIDVMLKKITEEQTNKTKKLLSDLNSKRRTRQRKAIMVVNSGNPPRTMLPKLSINGQQLMLTPINLDLSSVNMSAAAAAASVVNSVSAVSSAVVSLGGAGASLGVATTDGGGGGVGQQQQQQPAAQNIVYSGPVAAVARQIVNTTITTAPAAALSPAPSIMSSQMEPMVAAQQQANVYGGVTSTAGGTGYQEMISHQIPQSSKLAIPSFHQAYSNLIPQIMNTLKEPTSVQIETTGLGDSGTVAASGAEKSGQVASMVSPPTLGDMSLLELSINNSDSLFGPSNNCNPVVSTKFGDISKRDLVTDADSAVAKKTSDVDSVCTINLNDCSNLSNLSTLNNILNSLTCKSNEENAEAKAAIQESKLNLAIADNGVVVGASGLVGNGHATGSNGGYPLTHKRSEALLVEWTDSMNDVSLTGCFLNDLQSPEKPSKGHNIVHVLNENSRDSLFFNMDTIMDIIPPAGNRYDESSLINSLTSPTLNNIGNSDN